MKVQAGDPGAVAHIEHGGKTFRFRHHNPADHILEVLKRTGEFYEVDLLSALSNFVGTGDHVIDVGANIGTHSIFFAGVCGCDVTAFEANPLAVDILKSNVQLNELDRRIVVEPVAVGAASGKGCVVQPEIDNLGTGRIEAKPDGDIAIVSLDEYLADRAVRLIKIDVEGMEMDVLCGARATLERHHPVIALEARSREEYAAAQSFLAKLGYSPAGSFAFTPTHVFVDLSRDEPRRVIASLAAQLAHTSLSEFEHNNNLSQLKASIGSVRTAISASEASIAAIKHNVDQQNAQAQALRGTTTAIKAEMDRYQSGLDTQLALVGEKLTTVSNAVGGLQLSLSTAETALGDKIASVSKTVGDVQSSLSTAETALGDKIAAVATAIGDVRSSLGASETSLGEKLRAVNETLRAVQSSLAGVDAAHASSILRAGDRLADAMAKLEQRIANHASQVEIGQKVLDQRATDMFASIRRELLDELSAQARRIEAAASESAARTLMLVVSETAAVRTSVDGIGKTLLAQLGNERATLLETQEATVTSRIDALGSRLESIVEQRFRSIDTALEVTGERVERSLDGLGAVEQKLGRLGDDAAVMRRQASQAVEMQLTVGSVLEAAVHAVAADVRQHQDLLVDNKLLPSVRRQLDEIGRVIADAVGRQLAQIDVSALPTSSARTDPAFRPESASLALAAAGLDLTAPIQHETSGTTKNPQPPPLKVPIPSFLPPPVPAVETSNAYTSEHLRAGSNSARPETGAADPVGVTVTGPNTLASAASARDQTGASGRAANGAHDHGGPGGRAANGASTAPQVPPLMPSVASTVRQDQGRTKSRWTLRSPSPVAVSATALSKPAPNASIGVVSVPAFELRLPSAVRPSMPERFGGPSTRTLAEVDFRRGWNGHAWGQSSTQLADGGRVLCTKPERDAGIVGATYSVTGGTIIEIEVVSRTLAPAGQARIFRLLSGANDPIGYDFPLADGPTIVRTYIPFAASQLKIYVLASDAKPGPLFALETLALRVIDSDDHQRAVRATVGEPVYASMASIPSRVGMLRDTVGSLLPQCDIVRVFLNNYPDVPDFLQHPRIQYCRSQDWDDRGDAGKVFWIDRDGNDHGYRLIVDDDLIFPPEFSRVMTGKVASHGRRAIYATHAVLLRQPFVNYYDPSARAVTFHFGHELKTDHGAHIGATNALCLHTSAISMRWPDFKYCNSADVWLALHAQKANIPVLTPARPRNWVRESRHANPDETIYVSSLKRTRTRFDSSFVQDAALRHAGPLTLRTSSRRKLGIAFLASDGAELKQAVESFLALRSLEVEWVVAISGPLSEPAFAGELSRIAIGHETHLVDRGASDAEALRHIAALHAHLGLQASLVVDQCVRLSGSASGKAIEATTAVKVGDETLHLVQHAGDAAEAAGVCLIGAASPDVFSGAFVSDVGAAVGMGFEIVGATKLTSALLREAERVPAEPPRVGLRSKPGGSTANTFFERVQVLNLDRRPDRWAAMSRQLELAGIRAERFSAVDGSRPEIRAEYDAYATQQPVRLSRDVPPVRSSFDLYHNYVSQQARIAHLEGSSGRKAIASPGAWGYMRSYEAILEKALTDQVESLLVFDDDVVFHRNFGELFAKAVAQLPDDWLIVQLGTLQYHWTKPWADWKSDNLYVTNGSAVGSHAVGMRFDVLASLIDHVKRMDMPYDIGALSAVTRSFPDRCFVISPNLAIQRIGDSDINTSEFQQVRSREEVAATYRWTLGDYRFDV